MIKRYVSVSIKFLLILVILGLENILPVGASDILTPALLYSQFVPAIDSFSRLDSLRESHTALGHRISIQAMAAAPLRRYLATTNYGYQDVTPSNSNMALIVDIWKSQNFSWELNLLSGGIILTPYSPYKDENGKPIYTYTPIYDIQFLIMNRMRFKGQFDVTLGLLHQEKSEITTGKFVIQPGEAKIEYKIDPFTDRWLLSTNLWQIAADVVIERQLKNLRLGKSWQLPFLPSIKELFTGIMYNNYGNLFGTGPEIDFNYLSVIKGKLQIDLIPQVLLSMVTGNAPEGTKANGDNSNEIAIPVIVNALLEAHYNFLKKLTGDRFSVPVRVGISVNYNGVRGNSLARDTVSSGEYSGEQANPLYLGWNIQFGVVINPPKDNFFWSLMGFDLNVDISTNYIPTINLIPVYQSPIIVLYLGFHLF